MGPRLVIVMTIHNLGKESVLDESYGWEKHRPLLRASGHRLHPLELSREIRSHCLKSLSAGFEDFDCIPLWIVSGSEHPATRPPIPNQYEIQNSNWSFRMSCHGGYKHCMMASSRRTVGG